VIRRLLVGAAVLLAPLAELRAQVIQGTLVDNVNQQPLAGAFVTLIDAADGEVARAMTDREGRFVIEAPGPGAYRLRSKRIGFRPQTSASLNVERGQSLPYRLALDPIPVHLTEVVVAGDRQCDLGRAGGRPAVALWEEVREALSAVAWTSRVPGYWYENSLYERDRSETGRVRRDSTWSRTGYLRVPFQSAPPEELAAQGYVTTRGDELVYFAPDAEALLSDPFVKTHCFEVKLGRGGGDQDGLVGLAFAPARRREVTDIRGTLWLDRRTSELRYLEFTYANLPQQPNEESAGGRIEFLRIPSGAWIVRDWLIRMPLRRATGPVGVRETGGRALTIKTRDGIVVYSTPAEPPVVAVIAPLDSAPAPAAVVAVDSARPRTARRLPNVLTEEDIEGSTAADAYELVRQLRPNWLHRRGPTSVRDRTAGQMIVYVDGTRWGGVAELRNFRTDQLRQLHYLSGPEATMRFGTGHGGGVIEITTR
jgi:hypothetical protein